MSPVNGIIKAIDQLYKSNIEIKEEALFQICLELGYSNEIANTISNIHYIASKERDLKYASILPISQIELFVTDNCNLTCPYCFVKNKNNDRWMSVKVAKRSVDFLLKESRSTHNVQITFMGGEPFLNFNLISKIIPFANSKADVLGKKISYHVTTNGTLFDKNILLFMEKYKLRALVSVDGGEKNHNKTRKTISEMGTFETVIGSIKLLKKIQPWAGVRMTVIPDSVDDLFKDVKELFGLGVNYFNIAPASGVWWPYKSIQSWVNNSCLIFGWWKKKKEKYKIKFEIY